MTNPNCEYSFNVPVLYTLGNWFRSFNDNCGEWDPIRASKEAVPHFINEMNRPTSVGVSPNAYNANKIDQENNDESEESFAKEQNQFKASEVELLFHLYWLPHSHGPKAQLMLDEFEFLRKHASLIQNVPAICH